jgi:hypothetical protein
VRMRCMFGLGLGLVLVFVLVLVLVLVSGEMSKVRGCR